MKRLSSAVIAMLLAVPLFASSRFDAVVAAWSHLTVADAAAAPELTFTIGHLSIAMNGARVARLNAGETQGGIFAAGQGTFTYRSADATELPILSYNAKRQTHLTNQNGTLSGAIDHVLIITSNHPLPALGSTSAQPLAEEFSSHRELFDRDTRIALPNELVAQTLGFPGAKFVRVEIAAGRDHLVYIYDPNETGDELLYALRTVSTSDKKLDERRYPVILSKQPIGRQRGQPAAWPYVLRAVDYTLIADGENAALDVTETITLPSAAGALHLDLTENYLPRLNVPYRKAHLKSVTMDGKPLPFRHADDDLVVGLDAPHGPEVKLRFAIEGDFLYRPGGDNYWALGTTPWFPQPPLAGQFYTVHSVVKVKKPFIVIAPGNTVSKKEEGDFYVVENVIDTPTQLAVVLGGKYNVVEDTSDNPTIRVATYAMRNDRAANQLTHLARSIISYYQYFLGPFPYREFNIIQINALGFGQAPPGTMFITNEAFNPTQGENALFSQGINERFAHELAHQYWGHVVKMPNEEEQWLTESFAEYSAALVLKRIKNEGSYNRLVATWKRNASDATGVAPIPYANRISGDERDAFMHRFHLLYDKGPYLLYTLHKQLGDDAFLTLLKSYQKSFRWKFGTTQLLAGLLQFMTKKDFQPFFDTYFWGTAMPE